MGVGWLVRGGMLELGLSVLGERLKLNHERLQRRWQGEVYGPSHLPLNALILDCAALAVQV